MPYLAAALANYMYMFSRLRAHAPRVAAAGCAGLAAYAAHRSSEAAECSTSGPFDEPRNGIEPIHRSNMTSAPLSRPLSRGKTIAEASEDLSRARKRIAIFGGSFNPITNAHLNCAAEIIHSKLADEVWITPCGARPDKASLKTPGLHRLIMCHLAVDTTFGSRFGVKVCDEEMKEPRNIPTIILMRRLKAKHPSYDFSFVVGSDLIPTLHEWDAPGCEGRWDAISNAGEKFKEENHFLGARARARQRGGEQPHALVSLARAPRRRICCRLRVCPRTTAPCHVAVIDRPGEHEDLEASTLTPNFEMIAPALEVRAARAKPTHDEALPHAHSAVAFVAHTWAVAAGWAGARLAVDGDAPLVVRSASSDARRRRHCALSASHGRARPPCAPALPSRTLLPTPCCRHIFGLAPSFLPSGPLAARIST